MLTAWLTKELIQKALHWIIPALLLVTLIGGLSWYIESIKSDRELAKSNLATAQLGLSIATVANKHNEETIASLNRFREIDSTTILQMYNDNQSLNKQARTQTEARKALGASNVEVKTFLDTPVPPDLRRLLNSANASSGDQRAGPESVSTGRVANTTGATGPR